jgi:hypothetical protein
MHLCPRLAVLGLTAVPLLACAPIPRGEYQRGDMNWTYVVVFGATHQVLFGHVGIPANADEGVDALQTIARTLRFE